MLTAASYERPTRTKPVVNVRVRGRACERICVNMWVYCIVSSLFSVGLVSERALDAMTQVMTVVLVRHWEWIWTGGFCSLGRVN